jgi:NAD(P)-dependent dehydrogenase (short-subunit alcohol dehydrogenase family)
MTERSGPPVLSLEGRTALVTGGGTGIGEACAAALAGAGAQVTICGPDLAVLEAAAAKMSGEGIVPVRSIVADVTVEDQVAAAVDDAAIGGVLDIALANAGIAMPGSLLHLGDEHWMGPIGVNLIGTVNTFKYAARKMLHRGGSIIAISSIAAIRPAAFMSPYSVTKAAVDELIRSSAAELGRFGIRVNGVRPGWVATDAVASSTPPENMKIIHDGTPLAGLSKLGGLGLPEDIGRAVVYFASDYSSWVTGQTLGVCGGSSLPPTSGDFEYLARMLFPDDMARDFPVEV